MVARKTAIESNNNDGNNDPTIILCATMHVIYDCCAKTQCVHVCVCVCGSAANTWLQHAHAIFHKPTELIMDGLMSAKKNHNPVKWSQMTYQTQNHRKLVMF